MYQHHATATRSRRDLASNLGKNAFVLSKTASVRVGSGLFEQTETLKGVGLMPQYNPFFSLKNPATANPAPGSLDMQGVSQLVAQGMSAALNVTGQKLVKTGPGRLVRIIIIIIIISGG